MAEESPPETGKTLKVRIAVSVGKDGRWIAYGASDEPDEVVQDFVASGLDGVHATYFVLATLPRLEVNDFLSHDVIPHAEG